MKMDATVIPPFLNGQPEKITELSSNEILLRFRELERRVQSLEASGNVVKRKLAEHVADNVGIIGLKDAVTYKHKALRVLWVILMILGMGGTVYYIYKSVDQYLEDTTATKITLAKNDSYSYPPFVICPPWWINVKDKPDLSLDGLKYSLAYSPHLFGHYLDAKQLPNDLISGKESFLKFYTKKGYKSISEYFLDIAADMISAEHTDHTTLSMKCEECESHVEKIPMEFGICYIVRLKPATRNVSAFDLKFYNTYDMDGILPKDDAWNFDILTGMETSTPSYYLAAFMFHYLNINIQRNIMLKSCVDPKKNPGYTQQSCILECMRNADPTLKWGDKNPNDTPNRLDDLIDHILKREDFESVHLMDMVRNRSRNESIRSPNTQKALAYAVWMDQFKNDADLTNDTALQHILKNMTESKVSVDKLIDCHNVCGHECDKLTYDLTFQSSHKEDDEEAKNKSICFMNIKHSALAQGGITTWEEIDTMSFSDLVSNVGGTLGLFLGCTIMTMAQLILSLIDYLFGEKRISEGEAN